MICKQYQQFVKINLKFFFNKNGRLRWETRAIFFGFKTIYRKEKFIMTEYRLRQIILEELSRQDVRAMIDSKIESYHKEKEFKKIVRGIAADVIEDLFKEMWRKNGFWKNSLKNG